MNISLRTAGLAHLPLLGAILTMGCQDLVEPRTDPFVIEGVVVDTEADHPRAPGAQWFEITDVEYTYEDPDDEERFDPETGELWGRAFINPLPGTRCFAENGDALDPIGCGRVAVGDVIRAWGAPRQAVAMFSLPPGYHTDQIVVVRE